MSNDDAMASCSAAEVPRAVRLHVLPQRPVQSITTLEECTAVTATFGRADWVNFYEAVKGLPDGTIHASSLVISLVSAVLIQREEQAVDEKHHVEPMFMKPPADELTLEWHIAQADAKAPDAIEMIKLAMQGRCNAHVARLQHAISLLHMPLNATDVSTASNIVHTLIHDLQELGLGALALHRLKEANRHTRDVLMMLCRAGIYNSPKDRDGFLRTAEEAGVDLDDQETQSLLLLAYDKDAWNKAHGFGSNNKVRQRYTGPRPARANPNRETRHTRVARSDAISPERRSRMEPMFVRTHAALTETDVGPQALNPDEDVEVSRDAQSWSP